MKKVLLFLCLVLFISQTRAQDEEKTSFKKHVALKWAPAGIYFGKITVGGEFNLARKSSFTLSVGFPAEKTITRNIDNKDRTLYMKSFSAMGGYRFYFGKKGMKGLYFEPYVKYLDSKATINTDFTIGGTNQAFLLSSTYTGVGVGAQLGVQILIAKRIVIDWYFLGPEANSSKHELSAQQTSAGPAWDATAASDAQEEISKFIKDIPLIGDKASVTVDAAQKRMATNYSGFLPGFRFGISIGVRF